MILYLKNDISDGLVESIAVDYDAIIIKREKEIILVTPSKYKKVEEKHSRYIENLFIFDNDIQLASRSYRKSTREVKIGNLLIGGKSRNCILIIGPCGIESKDFIEQTAALLGESGLQTLRAGAYKPRTSPYTFQGPGLDGLKILCDIREKYGYSIVTEVRDSTHVEEVLAIADVVQIGAKAMYDHGILRKCGKSNKPILLKRGFGSTIQEFVQAAEFILSGGNENVILCERGIRTFETKSRFTLDLCGVAYLKEYTNLPIILDPSHAMGYSYGVPDLARACMAMDVEGLLLEVHPDPAKAKSDASQQLNHDEFKKLYPSLQKIALAVNRNIV